MKIAAPPLATEGETARGGGSAVPNLVFCCFLNLPKKPCRRKTSAW